MDFSSDNESIREAVRRYLAENHPFDPRRFSLPPDYEASTQTWKTFGELGWLSLPFPEEVGGLGVGADSVVALLEEFGRAIVLEPYVGCVLLPGRAILDLGNATQRAELLAPLIEGRQRFALAHREYPSSEIGIETRAVLNSGNWRLEGRKSFVLGGAMADHFLVSACTDAGVDLFVVPGRAAGLEQQVFRTLDGGFAADLVLSGVLVGRDSRLGEGAWSAAAIARVLAAGCAGACAEAVGAMRALLEATVAYTQIRQQFGQALAKYQALQHRMARMSILCEEATAAALHAAHRVLAHPTARDRAVSGAKIKIGTAGRWVAQQAIQLHGGIGMTSELAVGWHTKRLLMFENVLGTTQEHMKAYARLLRESSIGLQDVLTAGEEH